jgi:3-oxoadipate enol-lactonase
VARTRFARNGELRIGYEVGGGLRGRRSPWLVLVQGLGFDRSGWDPVTRRLGRRFRLVLIDNRGCGRSDPSPGSFGVPDMVADVIAVLDAARIRRAHLLGISLGGMVAQEVAIEHPERVNRLVLAATTPGWPYGHPMPPASTALMMSTRRLEPEVALRRHVENALSATTVVERPELVERLIRHQKARPTDPKAWSALAAAGASYTGGRRQTQIQAPTLVLYGEDDTVVDPRNSKLLAERIPNATLVSFPGLGHLFFWEDPAAFVDALTRFLRVS